MYPQLISKFVEQESLPQAYAADAVTWFVPLVQRIAMRLTEQASELIIGINGAQGTGKSTLAKLMTVLLEEQGFSIANLSIDDFYLSKQARLELSREVHPLLASRGVPGTHDINLALAKIDELSSATVQQQILLPAFDKAIDDCVPRENCMRITGPVDAIILEGWFIGAQPQSDSELAEPVNQLEAVADADGRWRHYVNHQLGQKYQELFSKLHMLIMLQAPSFEQVFQWRSLQEEKLRQQNPEAATGLMDDDSLRRFIEHFERLTRHCLQTIPARSEAVFRLDQSHRVIQSL